MVQPSLQWDTMYLAELTRSALAEPDHKHIVCSLTMRHMVVRNIVMYSSIGRIMMPKIRTNAIRYLILVALVFKPLALPVLAPPGPAPTLQAANFPVPAVAIHVSELTQILEMLPASPPTPTPGPAQPAISGGPLGGTTL